MEREVVFHENRFITIVTDALMLYEAAEECVDSHARGALTRACVLSICFAIEAAANSFLQAVECDKQLMDKIDRFSTLEKFDFVMQWGQGQGLIKGESRFQEVEKLLRARNSMVHPKINKKIIKVKKSKDDNGRVVYTENNDRKTESDFHFSNVESVRKAFKVMVNFLNAFVEEWWVGGRELAEQYLWPQFNDLQGQRKA